LKEVKWVAHAARMGFRWRIGNGRRVRFWEDQWFESCSLAIQFWEVYSIVNEQGKLLRKLGMVVILGLHLEEW
jgi:hypothetical protein